MSSQVVERPLIQTVVSQIFIVKSVIRPWCGVEDRDVVATIMLLLPFLALICAAGVRMNDSGLFIPDYPAEIFLPFSSTPPKEVSSSSDEKKTPSSPLPCKHCENHVINRDIFNQAETALLSCPDNSEGNTCFFKTAALKPSFLEDSVENLIDDKTKTVIRFLAKIHAAKDVFPQKVYPFLEELKKVYNAAKRFFDEASRFGTDGWQQTQKAPLYEQFLHLSKEEMVKELENSIDEVDLEEWLLAEELDCSELVDSRALAAARYVGQISTLRIFLKEVWTQAWKVVDLWEFRTKTLKAETFVKGFHRWLESQGLIPPALLGDVGKVRLYQERDGENMVESIAQEFRGLLQTTDDLWTEFYLRRQQLEVMYETNQDLFKRGGDAVDAVVGFVKLQIQNQNLQIQKSLEMKHLLRKWQTDFLSEFMSDEKIRACCQYLGKIDAFNKTFGEEQHIDDGEVVAELDGLVKSIDEFLLGSFPNAVDAVLEKLQVDAENKTRAVLEDSLPRLTTEKEKGSRSKEEEDFKKRFRKNLPLQWKTVWEHALGLEGGEKNKDTVSVSELQLDKSAIDVGTDKIVFSTTDSSNHSSNQ